MIEVALIIMGIVVGWIISRIVLSIQIIRLNPALTNKILDEMEKESTIIYTEKSDKYIYLYNNKTNEFICQDIDLAAALKKAYEFTKISPTAIVSDEGNIVVVYKGKIVEYTKKDES